MISAIEAALLGLREHQVAPFARGSAIAQERLRKLYDRREPALTALLLLGAVANLGIAILGLLFARELAHRGELPFAATAVGLFVTIILLADAAPKALALARPAGTLRRSSAFALGIERALRPVGHAMGAVADPIASRLAPRGLATAARIEDDEVETLVKMRHADGELPEWEAEVIHEIVKLGGKTAKDVMTPRVNVIVAAEGSTRDEIRSLTDSPHRLLPICQGEPDAIVGVLDCSAYLAGESWQFATRPAQFVPETMQALELLSDQVAGARQMAIVLDEHGGFEGIATASDIIEDLVRDALPPDSGRSEIHPLGGGRYLASGAARLDDLKDELGAPLAEDGIDTIGGLVFTRRGKVPEIGQSLKAAGHRITVKQVSDKRVEEVLIEPIIIVREKEATPR